MTDARLPPLALRPLHYRYLRELVAAPELERFLGGHGLDLAVTDQADAVRVRVAAGIELLERRVLAAFVAAWRRQAWACLVWAIAAGIGFGAGMGLDGPRAVVCAVLLGVATPIALAALRAQFRLRRDMALLRVVRTRYRGPVAACESSEELVELAREIWSEVGALTAR